jgi:hypothetical protein
MPSQNSDSETEAQRASNEVSNLSTDRAPIPTKLRQEVRRLVGHYGGDAVKRAVKGQTRTKRGPKKIADWKELRPFVIADARVWLEGRDPFKLLTNHALAKSFAERNPGHSAISTFDRIRRKLRTEPFNRRWYVLVTAAELSHDAYPHAAYLRALNALAELPDVGEGWSVILDGARNKLATYRRCYGSAAAATLTMAEIEEAVAGPQMQLNSLAGVG